LKQLTPEEAVETYLEWLTFAYRYADSEVATPTMTPDMSQRASYYITMNLSADKILNQRLDSFEFVKSNYQGEIALIDTKEQWTFNYLSKKTGEFSELYEASYEVRYTVLLVDGVWVVQSVAADKTSTTEDPDS
jgi:hypothetical protein